MKKPLGALSACLVLFANPAVARAACSNDLECKGDRVCENGVCVSPNQAKTPPTRNEPRIVPTKTASGDAGWTQGAGTMGIVAAGLVLALGSVAVALNEAIEVDIEETNIPALAAGSVATLVGAIMIPIVASGAISGVEDGPLGLQIAGWVSYGFFLLNAIALIAIGATGEIEVDAIPIANTTLLGTASALFFAINAFVGHSRSSYAAAPPKVLPIATVIRGTTGARQPGFGLALQF